MKLWHAFGVSALVPLLLNACNGPNTSLTKEKRVETQAEAASTHLAVISVAPWSQYATALQPRFGLTSAQAFASALPVTAGFDRQVIDQLRASLGLEVQETLLGGFANRGAGETSSIAAPDAPEGTDLPDFADFDPTRAASLVDDRFLQLSAATALYQEAAIIDRYLASSPLRDDYYPYFVRLQMSVLPKYRTAPYDVYADIAFNVQDGASDNSLKPKPENLTKKQPIVLPLLVSENLEVASRADSLDRLRSVALDLKAGAQNVAASGNIDRLIQKLENSYTRDRNSLFMVTRLGQSGIRARIGAGVGPSDTLVLVPRQHYISLVVLVPKPEANRPARPTIQARMATTMRDARNGEMLEGGFGAEGPEYEELLKRLAEGHNLVDPTCSDSEGAAREGFKVLTGPLRTAVYRGDWEGFTAKWRECFKNTKADENEMVDLWNELQETLNQSKALVSFVLPPPPQLPLPQNVVLFDDGKKSAQVRLTSGELLSWSSVQAEMEVLFAGAKDGWVIPATDLSVDRNVMTVTFPSLGAMKPPLAARFLRLHGNDPIQSMTKEYLVRTVAITEDPSSKPKPLEVTSRQPFIVPDVKGTGSATLSIDKRATLPVFLDVSGARVMSVASGGTLDGEGRVRAVARTITLNLGDLVTGERVKVELRQKPDEASNSSLEFSIRRS